MKRYLVFIGLVLVVYSTVLAAQARTPAMSPLLGVWKQSREKSTYSPGPPPPVGLSAIRQYVAGDNGAIVAITFNLFAPGGLPSLGAISVANYDGKEYPQLTVATLVTSLSSHTAPEVTRTISYTQVDPYTVEIVQKENAKIVAMSTRTISADGKTMTDRSHYTNEEGEKVTNVLVFEKQR
jgi:hypothetical protein